MAGVRKRHHLSQMEYDEVSLVDAGAAPDAHVLIIKRHDQTANDNRVSTSRPSSSGTRGKSPRKSGTSTRAANWNSSRHPRVPSGPGGGEWATTSSESKKKYGRGGTTGADLAHRQGGATDAKTADAQLANYLKAHPGAAGTGGGGKKGKGKSGSAARKAAAAKKHAQVLAARKAKALARAKANALANAKRANAQAAANAAAATNAQILAYIQGKGSNPGTFHAGPGNSVGYRMALGKTRVAKKKPRFPVQADRLPSRDSGPIGKVFRGFVDSE